MRKTLCLFIVGILLIIFIYIFNISALPDNILIVEGEEISFRTAWGLEIKKDETSLVSKNIGESVKNDYEEGSFKVSFLGKNIKTINVNVISNTKVVPLGQTIGMKLYTKGVLVVGMSELENENGEKEKPYKNSGIEEGDSILFIDNKEIKNTNDVIEKVNSSKGKELKIKYSRDEQIMETSITPIKIENEYKIGLWIRDAAAGIGTLTFYEPSTDMFMTLGHGIEDIDTKEIVSIANGEIVPARIISVVKGKKDMPGEIKGVLTNDTGIGSIYKNTEFGVYGKIRKESINKGLEMDVATRDEIKEGKATMICQIDNNNPKEYEIEIEKIYLQDNTDNKSMLIKITDQELLEKTGGIVQGMSGAPIIQNGKFIGAVTNVLIKDPTRGYAIFGDLLVKQLRKV